MGQSVDRSGDHSLDGSIVGLVGRSVGEALDRAVGGSAGGYCSVAGTFLLNLDGHAATLPAAGDGNRGNSRR